MAAETPYEFVQRRRAEGASADLLRAELVARGHDADEVTLLLDAERLTPGVAGPPVAPASGETPWELVKKLRNEGFPPDAIAAELERKGVPSDDIKALLVDESVRPVEQADLGAGLPLQLIFGLLLILAGLLLILGGRISLLSIGLVVAGAARAGSAFASDRSTTALRAEARRQMATLAAEDPRARCAVHHHYASIGSCPRCGSFCCAQCTPMRGFAAGNVCMACQVLPDVRAGRSREASRVAAFTLLSAPGVLLALGLFQGGLADRPGALHRALVTTGFVSFPWFLLAGLQWHVRGAWPILLSLPLWLVYELVWTGAKQGLLAGVWFVPIVAAFYGWVNIRRAAKLEEALVVSSPAP